MKKLLLIVMLEAYCTSYVISMAQITEKNPSMHQNNSVNEILYRIKEEYKNNEYTTSNAILTASIEGDTKAFGVLKSLVQEDFIQGLGYRIATAINEKKFVSQSMSEVLSNYERVQDALNEINNGYKVNQIIFDALGEEKSWVYVAEDARDGDMKAYEVISEILEKNYLLDLPLVIANFLKRKSFKNKEMADHFSKDKKVQEWSIKLIEGQVPDLYL